MIFDVEITDSAGGTCVQAVSLPVVSGLNPSAWWTMETGPAAGPVPDVIAGINLHYLSGSFGLWSKEPGIIAIGWELEVESTGGKSHARVHTPISPELDFTDAGVTIAYWMLVTRDDPARGSPYVHYEFDVAGVSHQLEIFTNPLTVEAWLDFVGVLSFAPPGPGWHLYIVRIDNTANTVSVTIDQGVQNTGFIAPLGIGLYGNSVLQLSCTIGLVGPVVNARARYDEVAFFPEVLDADQSDSVYNGGLGITWP